ncbi:lytic transglycosylase domain-containing protein [Natronospira bacteriovora]|uniref:Transglycosylase SLT domain-containing protein n=1 Tax=Natronospira bacteriovora TaxID=3069753 RepID=A0ABU0W8J3_9GAMM|nr:lytic transglycosylase domain-containing protein [Natronospira sp. AB-CW4]MDQ2070277.1 transglycosylase SLT domain-containing protein [Natronospira sp. AB-CW4]
MDRQSGTVRKLAWGIGLLLLLSGNSATANLAEPVSSVEDYRFALERGESLPWPALVLDDHAALPWLKMLWLRSRFDSLPAEDVARFISRHRDRPFAAEFRRDWLLALGRAERWREFSRHYRGERDQALQCLADRARLAAGQQERANRAAAALWLSGRTLPAECEPLFDSARQTGAISDFMLRERYRMALARGNLSLAERLATDIGPEAEETVARRQAILNDPAALLDRLDPADQGVRDDIVAAIKRLARRDVLAAIRRWEVMHGQGLEVNGQDRFMVTRRIALEAARAHRPEAREWLDRSTANDRFIRAWRIRDALRTGDWEAALSAIDSHPRDDSRQWRYWRARALEALDQPQAATTLYRQLASHRDYYGLLAARRLGQPLSTDSRPIEVETDTLEQLRRHEGLRIARALLESGWESAARDEWRQALADQPRPARCQAALLAAEWGWASESIITAARSGCRGDHQLDYPLAFADQLKAHSERLNLDPAWAWSIMRAESLFATEARSRVGALGLMQLMPGTAAHMADRLGMAIEGERDILDPAHNIALGTAYLREMLDRFDGHPLIATAAYNAGPHRAEHWLPRNGQIAGDIWAETIPFQETRRYIRRVMTHSLGFDQRLGREDTGLHERLAAVGHPAIGECLLAGLPEESESASC